MAKVEKVNIREIAAKVGCSPMTVSRSLNNSPGVGEDKRKEVLRVAKRLGYSLNPLTSANMASIRASKKTHYKSTLALVCYTPKERKWPGVMNIIAGAKERAKELGFGLDILDLSTGNYTPSNLNRIIRSRGIRGIVVPLMEIDLSEFAIDYSNLSVISCFSGSTPNQFNRVIPDHYGDMDRLVRELVNRGYRRIGLMVSELLDASVIGYWKSRYFACMHAEGVGLIPPYMPKKDSDYSVDQFRGWLKEHRPEVLITTCESIFESQFFERSGLSVPEDVAIVKVNINCEREWLCGVVEANEGVGKVSIDMLAQQMYTNQYGPQDDAYTVLVPGRWTEGTSCPEIKSVAN